MPIGEMSDLEELARYCEEKRRWSFVLGSVPLNVSRSSNRHQWHFWAKTVPTLEVFWESGASGWSNDTDVEQLTCPT